LKFALFFIWAGLCGAEIVGRRSVGASEGFLGWIAYLESSRVLSFEATLPK
jgi:sugar phosphate permease